MEFCGPAIEALPMDGRLTMANMAIEAGGKCGYIQPDRITFAYLEGRAKSSYEAVYSDSDAEYAQTYTFDISNLEPQVAFLLPRIMCVRLVKPEASALTR